MSESVISEVIGYLQVVQRHFGHTKFTGGLSVFTLPAEVVGNLFPHHSFLTFPQWTRNLEERTHVQVVLQVRRRHIHIIRVPQVLYLVSHKNTHFCVIP